MVLSLLVSFNPHTHEGCDAKLRPVTQDFSVSIHTPTKGVTHITVRKVKGIASFNPHTHEGCDLLSE